MGIEPIANSLSPVESVGLTLLEDLIGAGKRGILRPSCAQIFPSPKKLAMGAKPKGRSDLDAIGRNSRCACTGSSNIGAVKSVLLRSGSVALWMVVFLLLFTGVMALYSLLAKPVSEICSDLRLPIWACGTGTWTWHEGVRRLRQTHAATKVFIFLLWLLAAIWADKHSR